MANETRNRREKKNLKRITILWTISSETNTNAKHPKTDILVCDVCCSHEHTSAVSVANMCAFKQIEMCVKRKCGVRVETRVVGKQNTFQQVDASQYSVHASRAVSVNCDRISRIPLLSIEIVIIRNSNNTK